MRGCVWGGPIACGYESATWCGGGTDSCGYERNVLREAHTRQGGAGGDYNGGGMAGRGGALPTVRTLE